jgi:hypothetical protein
MKQLISILKQKDKIFQVIQLDQIKRYNKLLDQFKNDITIDDFEIESIIEVYDELSEELLLTIYSIFTDNKQLYNLKSLYGIDLKVSNITYNIIDTLGIKAIEQNIIIWSDINIKIQKYFNV